MLHRIVPRPVVITFAFGGALFVLVLMLTHLALMTS
jgi:hypothetical protein